MVNLLLVKLISPIVAIYPYSQLTKNCMGRPFKQQQDILTQCVEELVNQKILVTSVLVMRILKKLDSINSVAEMAKATRISSRHLQRSLKRETGFTPHDFLKNNAAPKIAFWL